MFFPHACSSHILLPVALCSTGITPLPRYYGDSDSPTVLFPVGVSLLHVYDLPIIPSPTTSDALASLSHATPQRARLPTTCSSSVWASPCPSRLATFQAESCSSSYGLIVRLPLLLTPPLGDAITVDYRPESACLKWTLTTPITYTRRRTRRRAYSRRPLTPPYVRFRIRRFINELAWPAYSRAVIEVQGNQSIASEMLGSCARHRRSTTARGHWWRISRLALPEGPVS